MKHRHILCMTLLPGGCAVSPKPQGRFIGRVVSLVQSALFKVDG